MIDFLDELHKYLIKRIRYYFYLRLTQIYEGFFRLG